jgi:hypothetical protein
VLERIAGAVDRLEDRRADRARRVHRHAVDAHADEMDEREAQTDGEPRHARRGALGGGAEDDDEEEEGQQELADQRRDQEALGLLGDRVHVVVGAQVGEVAVHVFHEHIQRRGGQQAARHQRADVHRHVLGIELAGRGEPDGHRGIEVTARDVPDGVRHRDHGQTEGQRHAQVVCSSPRKDDGADTAEGQPEGSQQLRHRFPSHVRLHEFGLPHFLPVFRRAQVR